MKKIFSILFALMLLLSLELVTVAPVAAQNTALSGFKCYPLDELTAPYVGEVVQMEDQFGAVEAVVEWAEFFCNPVAKWEEEMPPPILNRDHHLTLYSLSNEEEPQERIVKVENQFGTQQLVVSDPVMLGVPTHKLYPGEHYSPVGLDHFLLYEVIEGPSVEVEMDLYDQFGYEPGVFVYEPVYFANPVKKTHDGDVTLIGNPEAHLVFYRIASYSVSGWVLVDNQFNEQELEVYVDEYDPALLAVPSEKVDIPHVYPVRNIDTGKGYFIIQTAIDDPDTVDGHTIEVAAGEYDAFVVQGKANISIIGTEGATVSTAKLVSVDVGPIGDAWVMAAVYDSEDVNIEGIDFDGTGVSGKPVAVGIAYVHSTGRIADLTVENVIATELGAGVAIIGDVGTSTVKMTGVNISNNDDTGIYVCGGSTLEAHLNKIAGNAECGLLNDGGKSVDATGNWWGHASGPLHLSNPLGRGNAVIGDVDFKPWLEAEVVTETVTNSTVNAKAVADTEVVVKGTATVVVAKYSSNPHPTLSGYAAAASLDLAELDTFRELNIFSDVRVTYYKSGTEAEIRLYYTNAEAKGFDEESLRLLWWNGTNWAKCSHSDINTTDITGNYTYSGYMWATINATTTPSLACLNGTEWGGYGEPRERGSCFIAGAAYGTNTAKEIDILREFRDTVLLPNSLGTTLVSCYYKTSPPIAGFISQHEVLRTVVRVGFVDPTVAILNWSHDLWSTRG